MKPIVASLACVVSRFTDTVTLLCCPPRDRGRIRGRLIFLGTDTRGRDARTHRLLRSPCESQLHFSHGGGREGVRGEELAIRENTAELH